ncbi:MAG TPA: ATP-dependent metallopeptidase FtsH/Yme1/Tma family protein, partial [Gemmatimonadaceae bacterium]
MPSDQTKAQSSRDAARRTPASSRTDGQKRPDAGVGPLAMPPRRTWTWFIIILVVNFLVVRFLLPREGEPTTVPYTLFKQEITKGNVQEIYSRGESITGRFRAPVRFPAEPDTTSRIEPREVTTFATTLPAFVDPGLESLLIQNGTEISA